jgi:hypothetical protein
MVLTNESLLLIVLIILVLGVLPTWPYSSSWGYGPTGGLAAILAVILICVLLQGRPFFRSTGDDLRATAQDAGQALQSTGRDAADSLRRTVQ